jgi:hypothetical protein
MFQVVSLGFADSFEVLRVKRDRCGAECSICRVLEKAIYKRIAILRHSMVNVFQAMLNAPDKQFRHCIRSRPWPSICDPLQKSRSGVSHSLTTRAARIWDVGQW